MCVWSNVYFFKTLIKILLEPIGVNLLVSTGMDDSLYFWKATNLFGSNMNMIMNINNMNNEPWIMSKSNE